MITKYELRIGNYLESDGRDMIITGHYLSNAERGMKIDNPIPINEEWLLAFGFEKHIDTSGYKWCIGNFYIMQFGKNAFYCDYSLVFSVDFVHQLQNLYFALTQKELELIKSEATI